ncbi:MAG TPA: hypothetical protein VF791_18940 [Pyrinomonadaceae bacterium]
MNPQKSLWALFVMLMVLSIGAFDALSQAKGRQLKEYKQGPSFDLQNYFFVEGNQEIAPLRHFLWQQWTTHTKSFSNVIFYTKEGEPTKCRFFIEPDSTGQWRVVSECKVSVCPYSSKKRCRKYLNTTFTDIYDMVERIEYDDMLFTSSRLKRPSRQIPDDQDIDPLKFVLKLKNSVSGKTIEL